MQLSVCSCSNLRLVKKEVNVLFHARDACFNPYYAFLSLKTFPGFHFGLNPFGCSMLTSSSNVPFRNAVQMSTWWIFKPSFTAIAINNLMAWILTTGAKVSL